MVNRKVDRRVRNSNFSAFRVFAGDYANLARLKMGARYILVPLILMCFLSSVCAVTSIQQKMQGDSEISQFYTMMAQSETVNLTLSIRHVTIFAPINRAFQTIELEESLLTDDRLVRYHIINMARRTDQLGSKLTSDLDGNPPLWITYKNNEIFINNARILVNDPTQVNFVTKNARNMEQILHKIDEVLIPVISPNNEVFNPNAWDFIEKHEYLTNKKNHRIRTFRQKIITNKKQDIFKNGEGHTFFVPIDDGFTNPKSDSVDAKVIDGHVIPKKVLFTNPTNKEERFETLADTDNVKVFVSFFEETQGKAKTISVKSHTVFADNNHTKGVVIATIVQANIPVSNGVVHLIQKPLMVVDQTIKQFLESNKDKENGILSRFCQEIADAGDVGKDFLRTLANANHLTLFAPTNSAWEDANLKVLLKDKSRIKDILNMHVIDKRVYMDQIYNKETIKEPTLTLQKSLFFSLLENKDQRVIMVEGGGVTATVIQPDIAASNGVIHITDRVFGLPYSSIFEKLRQDPSLNDTNFLVSKTAFHEQLNDTTKKYTFFVPSSKAWSDAALDMPTAIKTLFMKEFKYHAEQVLEKHLVVADQPFTMENIISLQGAYNREVELDTIRDKLKITVEGKRDHNNPARNSTFIINWKGKKIPVFRPNLECTNGIIHVIDYPFIAKGDIRVSASGANCLSFIPHIFMILIAKWLL